MLTNRLQVLAPLLLAAPLAWGVASRAQPPDVPVAISKPEAQAPRDLPLLPLALDDWLAQNGGMTRLTLKMEDATAQEIAQAVTKQTGVQLVAEDNGRGPNNEAPRFSVEATGQPFWEAIAQWNRGDKPEGARLGLQRDWSNRERWRLVTWGQGQKGRSIQVGPAFITAMQLSVSSSRSRDLDPKEDPQLNPEAKAVPESKSMSVQCSMQFDPRLRPHILGLITQIEGAQDDQGRAIQPGESYWQAWLDDHNDYAHFSLAAPERDAKRLRSLKGTLRLAVATKRENWEVDLAPILAAAPKAAPKGAVKGPPLAEKSFKSENAEVKIRLDSIEPQMNGWSLRLHLERREVGPARVFKARGPNHGNEARLGSFHDTTRAVRLLNADGEALPVSGTSGNSNEGNAEVARTIDIEMTIGRAGPEGDVEKNTPAKLVMDVPLEWREVQAPFEFKNLPLP